MLNSTTQTNIDFESMYFNPYFDEIILNSANFDPDVNYHRDNIPSLQSNYYSPEEFQQNFKD